MSNLLAYIPVLNQRHIDWFKKHENSRLFLIPQKITEEFLPRLNRNMAAVPTEVMVQMLRATNLVNGVFTMDQKWANSVNFQDGIWHEWVLPDEDISHLVSEKYLKSKGAESTFEMIWARWDMTAVLKEQPILTDVLVSKSVLDNIRMQIANGEAQNSPDWWRRVGAVVFNSEGRQQALAHNTHMPDEYETYIFGDPSLNRDAGQKGKSCVLHAERVVISLCARRGIPLEGSSIYSTTFPCEDCAREIAFAGIKHVYFREGYSVLNAQEVLQSRGVQIIQVIE